MYTEGRPQPIAQGRFDQKPFPHILVYLLQQQLTGTLEISAVDREASIYFRDGMPAKVHMLTKGRELGQILLEMGLISADQLEACRREMTANGGYQGQVLLRQGAIDAAGMVRGLRMQILHKLVDIFSMTEAEFAFYETVNLLAGFGPDEIYPIDPYPVLMAGVRAHSASLPMEAVLKAVDGPWLSFASTEALKRFRLTDPEKEVCRAIMGKPRTFFELVSHQGLDLTALRNVLYTARITKELVLTEPTVGTERAPTQPVPRSHFDTTIPRASVVTTSPEEDALRKKILAKAAGLSDQNFYRMLELPFGAPIDEVRASFVYLAKTYHPDRATGPIEDLQETLEYIFSNLSEAHATLTDPESREEYETVYGEEGRRADAEEDDVAAVRETLEAETLFQKALVLLRRNQLDRATEMIDLARQLNPQEGEYLAVHAKIQLLQRSSAAPVEDLLQQMRRAEELNPKSERVNLYLAQALQRANRGSEAKKHFERVIGINPHNVEAARELRLMEMRRAREKPEKKGFLGKLFGKN